MWRVLVICLGTLLMAVGLCLFMVWPSSVSRTLAKHVQHGPGTVIDFAEVAPFPWDRLYIFGPYSSSEQIDQCLGFHWQGSQWSSIKDSESENLVVFVQGRRVVHWFDYPRGRGELGYLTDCRGYARGDARFRVKREGKWLVLVGGEMDE